MRRNIGAEVFLAVIANGIVVVAFLVVVASGIVVVVFLVVIANAVIVNDDDLLLVIF